MELFFWTVRVLFANDVLLYLECQGFVGMTGFDLFIEQKIIFINMHPAAHTCVVCTVVGIPHQNTRPDLCRVVRVVWQFLFQHHSRCAYEIRQTDLIAHSQLQQHTTRMSSITVGRWKSQSMMRISREHGIWKLRLQPPLVMWWFWLLHSESVDGTNPVFQNSIEFLSNSDLDLHVFLTNKLNRSIWHGDFRLPFSTVSPDSQETQAGFGFLCFGDHCFFWHWSSWH